MSFGTMTSSSKYIIIPNFILEKEIVTNYLLNALLQN